MLHLPVGSEGAIAVTGPRIPPSKHVTIKNVLENRQRKNEFPEQTLFSNSLRVTNGPPKINNAFLLTIRI
jgi:hypothetical protein